MGLENINAIRKYKRLTIEQLSELSGVPLSTVKKISAGITANPSLDTVRALARALDCTLDDLESQVWAVKEIIQSEDISPTAHRIARAYDIAPEPTQRIVDVTLEPYMDKAPPPRIKLSEPDIKLTQALSDVNSPDPESYRALPLHLLPASAGSGEFLDSNDFELVDVGLEVPHSAHYGVRISGNSMEPEYPDGYIVWAKRTVEVGEGQIGIFILNGEGYIKKWSHGRLLSLNPMYEPIVIRPEDDFYTRGLVVAVTENVYQ